MSNLEVLKIINYICYLDTDKFHELLSEALTPIAFNNIINPDSTLLNLLIFDIIHLTQERQCQRKEKRLLTQSFFLLKESHEWKWLELRVKESLMECNVTRRITIPDNDLFE